MRVPPGAGPSLSRTRDVLALPRTAAWPARTSPARQPARTWIPSPAETVPTTRFCPSVPPETGRAVPPSPICRSGRAETAPARLPAQICPPRRAETAPALPPALTRPTGKTETAPALPPALTRPTGKAETAPALPPAPTRPTGTAETAPAALTAPTWRFFPAGIAPACRWIVNLRLRDRTTAGLSAPRPGNRRAASRWAGRRRRRGGPTAPAGPARWLRTWSVARPGRPAPSPRCSADRCGSRNPYARFLPGSPCCRGHRRA